MALPRVLYTEDHSGNENEFSALRPESDNFLAAAQNEVAVFRRRRAEIVYYDPWPVK